MTDTFTNQEPAAAESQEKPEGLSVEEQAEHQRIAEFNAHPHTQLTKLASDLRTPALDVHARISQLHNAVSRLTQMFLSQITPPAQPGGSDEGK